MSLTRYLGLLAITTLSIAPAAMAASAERSDDPSVLRSEVEALKSKVKNQDAEINRMKAEQGEQWLSEERAKEIRGIVQDVLADADSRASLQSDGATAGYNRGFFLASPDGNFRLNLSGQLQIRYAASRLSTRSINQLDPGTYQNPAVGPQGSFPGGNEIKGYQGYVGGSNNIQRIARGFEVRRMKLDFNGHVVDPSWQYKVVLSYSQTSAQGTFPTVGTSNSQFGVQSTGMTGAANNPQGPGASGASAGLEDAWINKKLDENWSVKVGQFKSPFLKEELVSSRNQLAAERSLVNQFFSTKFTQGIELTFQNDCLRVIGSFNDGGNNANTSAIIGSNEYLGSDTDWALSGRVEYKIAGDWRQFSDMSSFVGESFAMYIGGGVNWQRGSRNSGSMENNTWTMGSGANGNLVASGATVSGSGIPIMIPAAALRYPNNIPVNGNDEVTNLSWTVDTMMDFGGFSIFGAFVGNVAYNIPAGWVANPSGGYTPLAGTGNGLNVVPNNVSLIPSNGSDGGVYAFVPGYGYGNSPIFSYGAVVQAGWFIVDDVELFGRYEFYSTINNGANGYAGNTPTFWGALPGGSSPFANNTRTNNAGAVPEGANTPNDNYVGGNTNPYYAYNFGGNPFAAQFNQIVTVGANWYPAGYKNRMIKVTGDLAYSFNPVLFTNGIYGQSITGADYRYDGGRDGGGQWVGRLQLQLLF
ncbi:MAG: hypothetical protein KF724_12605 [Phycisphaeraceae bacterium]|nr:hypothetical protein [Phycisphaeraceae bacterium]